MPKDTLNIFFACDENYAPLMAVTMESVKLSAMTKRSYHVRVLHTDISEETKKLIKSHAESASFRIDFIDVSEKISKVSDMLHTRDYYSKTTYYRIFIPELFPELEKALYLDSDIIATDDIADLYDTDIKDNLVGAVRDEFVYRTPVLRDYAKNRCGLERAELYFNAGVLLMNLSELRRFSFEDKFLKLLSEVKFDIAQDQDYLNVLCRGRVHYMSYEWNFMPFDENEEACLIHFNLDNKPWQKSGIVYDEMFWEIALRSPFFERIRKKRRAFRASDIRRSENETKALIEKAEAEARDKEENERIKKIADEIRGEVYS